MAGDERTRRGAPAAPGDEGRRTVPRRADAAQGTRAPVPRRAVDPAAQAQAAPAARRPPDVSATAAVQGAGAPSSGFDLLSRMGHELRSPLSAILGFAQILCGDEQSPLPPLQAGMVQQIEASGLTLLSMVNDLVELSRMEAGRLVLEAEGVDLVRLLQEVCAQLEPQAAAGAVTLVQSLPAQPVTVRTDRGRLRHLAANLLAHAIRYNRRGGRATVALTVVEGRARITVSDTGGGLEAETVQALFDPFARTTLDGSSLQGAGIGLLVARRLAQALGSALALDVTPGVGTATTFDLPLAEPAKRPDLPSNAQSAAAEGPSKALLRR